MKIELKDTINLMQSSDYKARFIAEYWQTKIRYEKLGIFISKIVWAREKGEGEPKHDCPLDLLKDQKAWMLLYLEILRERAVIEKVDLSEESFFECYKGDLEVEE